MNKNMRTVSVFWGNIKLISIGITEVSEEEKKEKESENIWEITVNKLLLMEEIK